MNRPLSHLQVPNEAVSVVLGAKTTPPLTLVERALKRGIDLAGSVILLLTLSPLLLVLALLVRLIDGSPIIYRRQVVGPRGKFDAYKFRTMCRGADAWLAADPDLRAEFEQNFKLRTDPRITRMGSWLRKFSLDELPQLFNVFRGQMSLVGPRMVTEPELEKYGDYQEMLLTVRPGLTGYWQVNGRQEVSYRERVFMDVYYIEHWSLALDLAILFRTPARVVSGRGAH